MIMVLLLPWHYNGYNSAWWCYDCVIVTPSLFYSYIFVLFFFKIEKVMEEEIWKGNEVREIKRKKLVCGL